MNRTGIADLPLHSGRVPEWLHERMARLGRVLVEAITLHYGRHEVLRRLAHPFWFQSFGAVMGMDWHSSGITTTVLGALKRGLGPGGRQLGLYVCGGKGVWSRRTPEELRFLGERVGIDAESLVLASRLTAKVDSAAVQGKVGAAAAAGHLIAVCPEIIQQPMKCRAICQSCSASKTPVGWWASGGGGSVPRDIK